MAHRILSQSQPATVQLDALITQMETTLGKSHTKSPFNGIYSHYGFSSQLEKEAEETKET
jgi:hypothetical protein